MAAFVILLPFEEEDLLLRHDQPHDTRQTT